MQQTYESSSQLSGKPKEKGSVEKSIVVLDVKPESAEIDLAKVKKCIMNDIQTWG